MSRDACKGSHDGDTRLESPMPDQQVCLCPETADGVSQVTGAS